MISGAFQLVFVAKRGKSYLSDIIIDTVNLHVNDSSQCHILRYLVRCLNFLIGNGHTKLESDNLYFSYLPTWTRNDYPQSILSTESCEMRCFAKNNTIINSWEDEKYCKCNKGADNVCTDFQMFCERESGSQPPKFFKIIGLKVNNLHIMHVPFQRLQSNHITFML